MKVVADEAAAGMSVCCTIHQPSAQIFAHFTHILLLKRGGKVCYFGTTKDMLPYFETNLQKKMHKHENPADFALEVASMPEEEVDPARLETGMDRYEFSLRLDMCLGWKCGH